MISIRCWVRGALRFVLTLAFFACGGEDVRPADVGQSSADLRSTPVVSPNLVLITLDTTRADRLGPYGYAKKTTPNLDRFAKQAKIFERAYSTSSWTLPSHASMLTGLLPREHGAQSDAESAVRPGNHAIRPLADDFSTLAELLQREGYRTGAVIGGPALGRELGVAQGFEIYDDEGINLGKPGRFVADSAVRMIEEFGDTPYFLFANFFDAHAPYAPPPPFKRKRVNENLHKGALIGRLMSGETPEPVGEYDEAHRAWIAEMLDGYDAEIRYMDLHLGRVLGAIAKSPRAGETIVVITADHGESFGEHFYLSHGAHLYEDNVRVPLLLRMPGESASSRVAEAVQVQQIFPTFLRAAGIEVPEGIPDRTLDSVGGNLLLEVRRADLNVKALGAFFDRDQVALQRWPHKLVQDSNGVRELYDLERDPDELIDLSVQQPELLAELAAILAEELERHPPRFTEVERPALRPETLEGLRALGYAE